MVAAGCWGDQQSDDPFCRDMCRRTGMNFVSVGYRHAPEHRFPTAAEDGYAATRWIAEHAAELGGIPGPVLTRAGAPAATSQPSLASWRAIAAARGSQANF